MRQVGDVLSDSPSNWKDYTTDPGFVTVVGFGFLLAGMGLCLLSKDLIPAYGYMAGAVVGLVGGHAWTDANKTKYMSEAKPADAKDPGHG